MSQASEAVSIRILDREYTVGVVPEERDSLAAAARLLDQKMREVRGANRMAAVDRVAVLAALNLAHELHAGGWTRLLAAVRFMKGLISHRQPVRRLLLLREAS